MTAWIIFTAWCAGIALAYYAIAMLIAVLIGWAIKRGMGE